ncbi:MAG: VanZ family protein [Oscillospiraceae bacterium]|nr:VanZ family protein [Oscillospiraceae bacterium]
MSRREIWIRLCGILLILNLIFIWGNSLLPAQISQAFSDWVKELLSSGSGSGVAATSGSGVLRKIAHFAEFASLGFLLLLRQRLQGKADWKAPAVAVLTACIDETIQLFVPGRGPGIMDVVLDVCGAAAGMLLLQTGHYLWKRKHAIQSGGK